jgi:hypothetical protein
MKLNLVFGGRMNSTCRIRNRNQHRPFPIVKCLLSRVLPLLCLCGSYLFALTSLTAPPNIHSTTSSHQSQNRLDKASENFSQKYRPTGETATLGAVVLLAPQRNEGSIWNIDRFCLLLRAIRSIDQHLNSKYGPYPIYVLLAKDHELDPRRKDAIYTDKDRDLIRRWAPNSTIYFEEINMYSNDALEPNSNRDLILQWRQGYEGSEPGRDLGYTSMCRLYSGRLQNMRFLQKYTFYLRMDDDSLLVDDFPFDPFVRMQEEQLTYVYRRDAFDNYGVKLLWKVAEKYVEHADKEKLPFVDPDKDMYDGWQPYNNFHISRVSFWKSAKWISLWNELNKQHAFMKYRLGDANVHAVAIMLMRKDEVDVWPEIPYVHNSNDMHEGWGKKSWGTECKDEYDK